MSTSFRTILSVAICALVFNGSAAFSAVVLASAGTAAGAVSADNMKKLSEQVNTGDKEIQQEKQADKAE